MVKKGEWKAYSQWIGDTYMYIAGRQKDMSQPLHGGNIEYVGEYEESKENIVALCKKLNKSEI
jgi:hypothetical protein